MKFKVKIHNCFFLVQTGSNHLLVICSKENVTKSNIPGVFEKYITDQYVFTQPEQLVQDKLNQSAETGNKYASAIDENK